jgi:hypothetical protein
MSNPATQSEFRTPEQIEADEAIAASYENYIVRDAVTGWTDLQATDERRKLADAAGRSNLKLDT